MTVTFWRKCPNGRTRIRTQSFKWRHNMRHYFTVRLNALTGGQGFGRRGSTKSICSAPFSLNALTGGQGFGHKGMEIYKLIFQTYVLMP